MMVSDNKSQSRTILKNNSVINLLAGLVAAKPSRVESADMTSVVSRSDLSMQSWACLGFVVIVDDVCVLLLFLFLHLGATPNSAQRLFLAARTQYVVPVFEPKTAAYSLIHCPISPV